MAKLFADQKRLDDDRRTAHDRREGADSISDDRRSDHRRGDHDRRSQIHASEVKTRKSLIEMEAYLDEMCDDHWSAILLKIDEKTALTHYRLQFFSASDRDRFLQDSPGAVAL